MFYVNNEGKPYDGWFRLSDEEGNGYNGSVDAGVAKFRLIADKDYYISWGGTGSSTKVHITEGCTIKEPVTKATAVFGGKATNRVRRVQQDMTTINVKYDDQFVYFSAEVAGSVNIFNIDSKLVKNLGVVGDRVGIYDLPQGSYVLTLTTADGAQTARFQKK